MRLPDIDDAWFVEARQVVRADAQRLAVYFPALARRCGRAALEPARVQVDGIAFERAAWRRCDVAGHLLIEASGVEDAALIELFQHGDLEERTIVMRHHAAVPIRPSTIALLAEAQRSNTNAWFEALVCDNNVLARALDSGLLPADEGYKILLKGAFMDLALDRFFGIEAHASPELTRLVTGLATEREAAGRAVWVDTCRVVAWAPMTGTRERVLRGLDDARLPYRAAAIDGLASLIEREHDAALVGAAASALARETDAQLRARLEAVTKTPGPRD